MVMNAPTILAALELQERLEKPETVEEVARAVFVDQWIDDHARIPIDWADAPDIEQDAWRRTARAAITALPDTAALVAEVERLNAGWQKANADNLALGLQLTATRAAGNTLAEEVEYLADFASTQCEFAGDLDGSMAALTEWKALGDD